MRTCVFFLCLLAVTLLPTVRSRTHGKHHRRHKTSAEPKDDVPEETNQLQVLPTLDTFESRRQNQEDESSSAVKAETSSSSAVLLSEEELIDLVKTEAEEESQDQKEKDEDKEKVKSEVEADTEKNGRVKVEEKKADKMSKDKTSDEEVRMFLLTDDSEGSTDSVAPADGGVHQPVGLKTNTRIDDKDDEDDDKADDAHNPERELFFSEQDYEKNVQGTEALDSPEESDEVRLQEHSHDKNSQQIQGNLDQDIIAEDEALSLLSGKNEKVNQNVSLNKEKKRKQRKNKRSRKHSPHREEVQPGEDQGKGQSQEAEGRSDNTVRKGKRRKLGKWGSLVGINPVQIRATVELYPNLKPAITGGIQVHQPEAQPDPCEGFHCKRGKTCKLDANKEPSCVCQEASDCPSTKNEFDRVCGTDNKTYDTSCALFATKCNLEGSKKGNKLHLDYTGPCKFIPPCMDKELTQFPLRMRDWLKNVLLQLYENDSASPGFLTAKQRSRVKKIFDSDRRLNAGNHSLDLLAHDFEKNYNMYIYPVHWQFAQLDQHPSDRYLSVSELAPLRVPLVPMEHCTSRFFQQCDVDKDKQVSFKEWISCFGIKSDNMDENLLF